ncbi:B12-binding domain-containing radical SAM protein [bacterium]|nr:B12-binding domain-containing radical SAM protein [bacterium]
MNKHVTLIRTPPVLPKTSITAQQGVPSLALAYLGAAIKEAQYKVSYIDALGEKLGKFSNFGVEGLLSAGLNLNEIIERIPIQTDFIGVSCQFSNDWIFSKRLLKLIHEKFPNTPLFVGGEHTTADYETILQQCPFVTACVLGEGEETVLDLLKALSERQNLNTVNGIAFLDNSQIKKSCPRKRIKQVNEIPWPDWEHLPLENYLNAGLGMAAQGIRSMPVLASRGCPYRCTFCSAPKMWDAKWVGRSVKDVVDEVRFYKKRYKIDHIEFYDMSPSINKKWLESLVEELNGIDLSWNFPSGMRSENLTPELIQKLKDAGCYKLTFAIETSAPKLIKQIKKKIDPDRALGLIHHAVTSGLVTKVNFIWGIEGQTKFDILYDYFYICKLAFAGLHDATCFAFVPYPGSEDFDRLKKENKIPMETEAYEKFLAFNVYNNPFKMKSWSKHIKNIHMTFWTLGGMALFYSLQFITRPYRIYLLVKRLIQKKPVTMLELALFALFNNFIKGRKLSTKVELIRESSEVVY